LTEAGFPRSESELQSQYNLVSQHMTGDICELTLQPKSATARKMMPQIKIAFSTKDSSLTATELEFADGSTMRNDFKNPELNPKLDESLFTPKLESDYKIVEPFK
jgi:outer membrane lipoprotein-sorting protein